ncbi:MAG: hypothetical protein D6733_01495 [Methanobacteriota archaeon]|nr:MAG: hypothetical protein D6733_01495 [Euryarchaeota archaeon]
MVMTGRDIVLLADLAVDLLAVAGFLYLLRQGYFTNIGGESLNRIFLEVGVVGLVLMGITVYLLLRKE